MCCAVDTIFQPRMTRMTRILLAALYSFRRGLRGITRLYLHLVGLGKTTATFFGAYSVTLHRKTYLCTNEYLIPLVYEQQIISHWHTKLRESP